MSTVTKSATAGGFPVAFSRLFWSNLAAQSAEQIGLAAAPIVAVLALGAGAGQTGLLLTAQTLPFLLLSIPAGLLADRSSRRRLMASAEALRFASLIIILALAERGLLTLPLLALLGFVGATGSVAYSVAAPSLVPALVLREGLTAANGKLELARSAAFTAGPALAGALIGWIGAAPAFGFAAALSIGAVVLLAGLQEPDRPALPARHVAHDLEEGAVFVLAHPLLRPILLTAVFFNMAFFTLQAIYAPYAIHHLGLSASGVGATLATYGVGMVVIALLASQIMRRLSFGRVIVIGPLAGFAAALVMVLTIWSPSPLLAGLSFFLIGGGPVLWTISSTTLRQVVTPGEFLGRTTAIIAVATYGSRPVGTLIGAVVGGSYGAETCLVVAALGFLIQAGVILTSPVPSLVQPPDPVGPGQRSWTRSGS